MAVLIPIKNIWWLMMFASDASGIVLSSKRNAEEIEENLPDLVADLLVEEVSRRFRQKLSVDYSPFEAELYRVRGRIDFLDTARKSLLSRGKIAVRFSKITHDTDVNRLALYALKRLSRVVSKGKRSALRSSIGKLKSVGVNDLAASVHVNRVFAKVRPDLRLVSLSKLALSLQLITETQGNDKFYEVQKDETWLRKLFETALGGFFKYHLKFPEWKVSGGSKFPWNLSDETDGFKTFMPQMATDIEIVNFYKRSKLIIDTKFTSVLTKGVWKETFKSNHFYQLNAYLDASKQSSKIRGEHTRLEGMLLYPSVGVDFSESAMLDGSRIRLCSVNLDSKPSEITSQLLALVRAE
jgi:5-methylcytosine-specific restriction enzyme subunit McrC